MRPFLKLLLFLLLCSIILFVVKAFSDRSGIPFERVFKDSFINASFTQDHHEVDVSEIIELEGLHPIVGEKTEQLIAEAASIDIDIIITDGYRSVEEQNELYRQGRKKGGQIVTNAKGGQSYHNFGLAIDYALLNDDGQPIWDTEYDGNQNGESDWFEVAEIAKELGFEWGGDWNHFVDYPHLQMTFGYSIQELKQAKNSEKSS